MASSLKAPDPFSFTGDLAAQWTAWRSQFEWYLKATRKNEADEEVLVAVLITLLGAEGLKIYNTFLFATAGDANKIKPVLDKFTAHFEPRRSECYERFKFRKRVQLPNESCETWLLDLRGLMKTCNYNDQAPSILRDQLVIGVADTGTQEKMLYEKDLDLDKAIDILRACEVSQARREHMALMEQPAVIHRLTTSSNRAEASSTGHQPQGTSASRQEHLECRNCGRRHASNRCWAADKQCHNCQSIGHLARYCKQQKKKKQQVHVISDDASGKSRQQEEEIHTISAPKSASVSADYFTIDALSLEDGSTEWFEVIEVEGTEVSSKLDSGASCNVLPAEVFHQIPKTEQCLRPGPRVKSYGASGGWLKVLGVQSFQVRHREKLWKLDFVVVDEPGQPTILGLRSCMQLDLIRRVHTIGEFPTTLPAVVQKYSSVFDGLGRLEKEHDIKLQPGATPVVHAARRIPYRLQGRVEAQLLEMEAAGILKRVTEPTEWVSPMVVASKPNGGLRLCIDPTELNKAIKRQHFSVPSAEELFGRISRAKYYAVLDATSGFYQIPLTTESSFLCTMATPIGRFRYLRLPFGVKSAPEVFQCTMMQLFGDLPGVEIYFDDFLVWGDTKEQLNDRLEAVFERCKKVDLRLNIKKCQFFLQKVRWLGHIIGEGVLQADPAKVEAIVNMPDPHDKQSLLRLLGMVTYLDKFCKNLSNLARPLRDLLKASAEWVWDAQQHAALQKLKDAISSLPVLRLYDPEQPLVVSVDASPTGLGAVLLQCDQPVSFSSVTLTSTQKGYVQIEKELLAVQFGLNRFRQYIYGQSVIVESDHKPLIGLLSKPIAESTPRIQRMRLQLQRYDFVLTYKPGRDLHIADALSRAPQPNLYEDDPSQNSEEQVHMILESVIPAADTRSRYATATADDPTLQLIQDLMNRGWPEHKRNCPVPAKPFWNVRHELTVADGLVLRREAVVVPASLRPEVLRRIHDGHFGEVKCVERAKSAVYWPGYCEQIRNAVAACSICQENRHKNPVQSLHPVELPNHPFEKVGTDLFEYNGAHYLILEDYYSKWPCVAPLKSLVASSVINEMERFFADFGVPSVLVSDNGPQFGCAEFRRFCQSKGILHTTSSPEYPRSNGLIERMVQTVKERLLKMIQEGSTLWEALAAIRSTPVSSSLPSPAVLLQSRNLRGSLPYAPAALQPRVVKPEVVKKQLQNSQTTASFNQVHPVDARSSSLQIGQQVRVLIKHKWILGKVSSVCPQPNSYVIHTTDGRYFRRNRTAINIDRAESRIPPAERVSIPPQSPPPVPLERVLQPAHPPQQPPSAVPSLERVTVGSTSRFQQTPTPRPPTPVDDSPFHGFPDAVRPEIERGTTRSGRPYLAAPRRLFASSK